MRVLVSDTSVLIDLERCELLQSAFALDAELVVPDVLFDRELSEHNGADLLTMGLRVESVDPDGVAQAQTYLKRQKRLSVPDALALTLARRHGWLLLSGDGALRTLAAEEEVVGWKLQRIRS